VWVELFSLFQDCLAFLSALVSIGILGTVCQFLQRSQWSFDKGCVEFVGQLREYFYLYTESNPCNSFFFFFFLSIGENNKRYGKKLSRDIVVQSQHWGGQGRIAEQNLKFKSIPIWLWNETLSRKKKKKERKVLCPSTTKKRSGGQFDKWWRRTTSESC
jgi:hypothetical protein